MKGYNYLNYRNQNYSLNIAPGLGSITVFAFF